MLVTLSLGRDAAATICIVTSARYYSGNVRARRRGPQVRNAEYGLCLGPSSVQTTKCLEAFNSKIKQFLKHRGTTIGELEPKYDPDDHQLPPGSSWLANWLWWQIDNMRAQ